MQRIEEFRVLPKFGPMFYTDKPYVILSGGRGSGKTTQCAVYLIMKLFEDEYNRSVISRYTQKSIKSSVYRDVLDLLEKFGLLPYVTITGDEIVNRANGNMIMTHSFRLADGNITAKSKGLAGCNIIMMDESQELPSEEEYIKVIDTFRMKGAERKIFVIFNPPSKRHWIYKRWFVGSVHSPNPKWFDTHLFIHSTYRDNLENLDPTKVAEWDRAEFDDPAYYRHHLSGEFTEGNEGQIFTEFKLGLPDPLGEYDVTYGLDWGFASDPTALIKVSKHNDKLYIKELLYDRNLTIPELAIRLTMLGLTKKDLIIADSAEPRSIEELRRHGFNVQPSYKGPDSVRSGIEKIKRFSVFMDPSSSNLHNEVDLYSWNEDSDKPIDKWNHLMDALRYSLSANGPTGEYGFAGPKKTTSSFEETTSRPPRRY